MNICKCGCGIFLRKDNKTGYQNLVLPNYTGNEIQIWQTLGFGMPIDTLPENKIEKYGLRIYPNPAKGELPGTKIPKDYKLHGIKDYLVILKERNIHLNISRKLKKLISKDTVQKMSGILLKLLHAVRKKNC